MLSKMRFFSKTPFLTLQFRPIFSSKNILINHTRTRHSERSRTDIFSTFNNFSPFVWNLVEYKKTYLSYFYYLIYISHTSVLLKYQFQLTLTADVTINLQVWVRVVVPRATGFLCWRCI